MSRILDLKKQMDGDLLLFPKGKATSSLRRFFDKGIDVFKQRDPRYKDRQWTPHLLRISGICERFAAGCHLDALAILARHSDFHTTLSVYVAKIYKRLSRPDSRGIKRRGSGYGV